MSDAMRLGPLLLSVSLLASWILSGQTHAADRCMYADEAAVASIEDVGPKNFAFSLLREEQTYFMLSLEKRNSEDSAKARWTIYERQGNSLLYCNIGQGEGVQPLRSLHHSDFDARYGMPGSGHPRCSAATEKLPGSLLVRAWATRELGESLVLHLTTVTGEHDFELIRSKADGHWILLTIEKKDTNKACYYARGDDSVVYVDLSPAKGSGTK